MFVGEAPGFHEDKQGVPFVGQAGKLLDKLLAGIGLTRSDVFVANVLKCRPPGNRDPQPDEIQACEGHLWKQIELIQPKVVATLGNFATKLLSGRPLGITRVHGQEQETTLGGNQRAAVSALPSGRRALHAADARGARERLPPAPRAARTRARARPRSRSRLSSRRPSRPSSSVCSSARQLYPSSRGRDGDELTRGDGGRCGAARRRVAARRRGDRGRRARLGQDDVRPRRVPLARSDRAGDEPDVHDRSPVRGNGAGVAPRPLPIHRAVSTRNGETSSRTSTTPSRSSSGPRPEPASCPRAAFRVAHAA